MNAHNILFYTFCIFGMILIHESDGKTCQRDGDESYQLKSVVNTRTLNAQIRKNSRNSAKIRLTLRTNPTEWFFSTTTRGLYCCHENDTYYMVVNKDEQVELSTTENDRWELLENSYRGRSILRHVSSRLYLAATGKRRLGLSNEPEDAISML